MRKMLKNKLIKYLFIAGIILTLGYVVFQYVLADSYTPPTEPITPQNAHQLELIETLEEYRSAYGSEVAFNADGTYFAATDIDEVDIWDTRTGEKIWSYEHETEYTESVNVIEFSPQGNRIASGTIAEWPTETMGSLLLCDIPDESCQTIAEQTFIRRIAFTPDETRLIYVGASAESLDDSLYIYDLDRQEVVSSFRVFYCVFDDCVFSLDGGFFGYRGDSSTGDDIFIVRNLFNDEFYEIQVPPSKYSTEWRATFNSTTTYFAVVEESTMELVILEIPALEERVRKTVASGLYQSVKLLFNPVQPHLAIALNPASGPGVIVILDRDTGEEVARLTDSKYLTDCMVYSPDGSLLVTTGGYSMYIWDMHEMSLINKIETGGSTPQLAFSHDATHLV